MSDGLVRSILKAKMYILVMKYVSEMQFME